MRSWCILWLLFSVGVFSGGVSKEIAALVTEYEAVWWLYLQYSEKFFAREYFFLLLRSRSHALIEESNQHILLKGLSTFSFHFCSFVTRQPVDTAFDLNMWLTFPWMSHALPNDLLSASSEGMLITVKQGNSTLWENMQRSVTTCTGP